MNDYYIGQTILWAGERYSTEMHAGVVGTKGGSASFSLMQLYMAVNFIICYDGLNH